MKRQIYSGKPKAGEWPFNYGTILIFTKDNGTIKIPVELNRKCSIFIDKANGKEYLDVQINHERVFLCDMSEIVLVSKNFY